MRKKTRKHRPVTSIWLAVFALWTLFITGLFSNLIGSPGIIQALRLRSLLNSKESELHETEIDIQHLDAERLKLEKSKVTQEKEIRRVLGYAASDEIIFDFTTSDRLVL